MRAAGLLPIVANDIYLQNRFRPERIQILYGGSGSGKSDWKATELLLRSLLDPYRRIMFCRKVGDTIRMSQFQLFKDVIKRYNLAPFFTVREADMRITCNQNGNVLFARGLDDVDKVMSIAEVTDIWLEEPLDRRGSISSSDFTELDRRLRSLLASNHIHLTFNPINRDSWIHDYFFKSDNYAPFALRTTYLDNHFSPPEQVRQFEILKKQKPEEYKVYALGEWGRLAQGLIFPEYKIIEAFPPGCRRWGYGLDWGFYPDPCAVVRVGVKGDTLILDEIIYENNLISATRDKLMKERGVSRYAKIHADNAPEAIEEMKAKGWHNISAATKGKGSVVAGLDIMKSFNIQITARSKNLKRELDHYSWEIDRRSEQPTGNPVDAWNHAIDAARYWVLENIRPGGSRFL